MLEMKQILSRFKYPYSMRLSKPSTPDPTPDLIQSSTTANASPPQAIAVLECPLPALVPENLRAEPVDNSPHLNSPLENLAPEVRRQLFSILGLEELSALVHASPVFHQQYLLDSRSLLCTCLETTLRRLTVDASAVYLHSLTDFSDMRTSEKVTQFLKSYQDQRSSTKHSIRTERLTEDEAVRKVAFHSSIIKPLARHYTG